MKRKLVFTALVGSFALLVSAGCGSGSSSSSSSAKQALTVKGSDTMVQLAQSWAEEFMKDHPDIAVTVTGGGSNTGIAALMNKGTDVANASRAIKPEEIDAASKNNIDIKEYAVAQDSLAIVVNPMNTISELTMAQIKDIYQGKVKNWKELGGPDMNIVVFSRESSSGTYTFFLEQVLDKEPFATTVMNLPATSQIVSSTSQDNGAIGYIGLGYITADVKVVAVKKDESSPAVIATVENTLNGSYPLARPLFQYYPGEPTGPVKTWLDWILSEKGQAIVEKLGFVPIK